MEKCNAYDDKSAVDDTAVTLPSYQNIIQNQKEKPSQCDLIASDAIRVEAPTVDNVPEVAGRRADKRAIEKQICSEKYMAACNCNVAKHDRSLNGELPDAPASAEPGILDVDDQKPKSGTIDKFGGYLQAITFAEQAAAVRDQCMAEREQCSCVEAVPKYIMAEDRPINEVQGGGKVFEEGLQKITMAVDSGAAETVVPHTLVMGHPIMETQASRSGVNYASATGQPIPNLAEQRRPLCTSEGSLRSMTFQAGSLDPRK